MSFLHRINNLNRENCIERDKMDNIVTDNEFQLVPGQSNENKAPQRVATPFPNVSTPSETVPEEKQAANVPDIIDEDQPMYVICANNEPLFYSRHEDIAKLKLTEIAEFLLVGVEDRGDFGKIELIDEYTIRVLIKNWFFSYKPLTTLTLVEIYDVESENCALNVD